MKTLQLAHDYRFEHHGLVGLVDAAASLMGEDAVELLGISSAAFCTYLFDPDDNPQYDRQRLASPHATLFSNYGPWESIHHYTGWELRPVEGLSTVDLLRLVIFELEHGRPLITLDADLKPALVTGCRIGVDERVLVTNAGDWTVGAQIELQKGDPVLTNWLLLVRPAEASPWAAPRARQQIEVLRWTHTHATNPREFFQETGENYAPGLRAYALLLDMLDGLTDPAFAAYAQEYVRALATARSAAAVCVRGWSDAIADEVGPVDEQLLRVASSYQDAADSLAQADNLFEAVTGALKAEKQAIEVLGDVVGRFPAQFGA